jgi:heat shock protein HslJ
MKKITYIALIAIAGLMSACSSSKTTSGAIPGTDSVAVDSGQREALSHKQLKGKWDVVSINLSQEEKSETMSDVFITFADSSFGGKAPCNHIGGSYRMDKNSISFDQIISTKMACERSSQENAFINLLDSKVSSYSITDNELLLKDDSNRTVLECRKAAN